MAPSSASYLFLHPFSPRLLLTLVLARLAASTLMNPALLPEFTCLPPTTPNKPFAIGCVSAMLALPHTQQGVDYHGVPAGNGRNRIVYDTALTSIGDPNSIYHLPRTSEFQGCRVTVRMADGVQFARVLWQDVQQYANSLINRCVGDARAVPRRPGPGAGGSTSIGAVLISVEAVVPASNGKPGGNNGFSPAPGTRDGGIEAYYPQGLGTS